MPIPTLSIEEYLTSKGHIIAGIDEVGRGALAGPVVAGVVLLSRPVYIEGAKDSKLLTANQRESLALTIKNSVYWSIGIADNSFIDKYGIRYATYVAMYRALEKLPIKPDVLLIDGVKSVIKFSNYSAFYFTKGDQRLASISYASILAKVYRDQLMIKLAQQFPHYYWDKNKGYGTKEHRLALKNFGTSSYHRRTFVRKIIINA